MSDGIAQGDGLGPLFFSLGLDELLTAVREAMRDLNVDSTILGHVVHAVGSTDGRLDSGAHIPVTDDLPLTLVAAPTYAEIDALAEDARGALRVSVRVGPPSDSASYVAEVSWGAVPLKYFGPKEIKTKPELLCLCAPHRLGGCAHSHLLGRACIGASIYLRSPVFESHAAPA